MRSAALGFLVLAPAVAQEEPPARPAEFFERHVRPLLVEHCYRCHSRSAQKLKGGLFLDSREGMLKGGDSGAAIVPGKPDESLLLRALRWTDADLKMPPQKKLPLERVREVEAWIRMGAPWPLSTRDAVGSPRRQVGLSLEEGRRFWAYRAPVATPSGRGGIDGYIRAALEGKGLRPSPPAGKAVLVRRLYLDLVGLPPSPEEVEAFEGDPSEDAYDRLVDRLLGSPRFGERWGRHWLDVARFSESLTLRGFLLPGAWRYRNYVIDAMNADLPYDEFVREQISGDLIPGGSLEERRRRQVAVTFLLMGNTNLEEQDKKQLEMDVVDEELDTLGRAFLAQTIGCARCHDHKFDPIPTKDYYAMAGILKNSRILEHANVSKHLERPLPAAPEREREIEEHEAAVTALEARIRSEKEKRGASAAGGGRPSGVLAVAEVPGIVVDDEKAEKVGLWKRSTYSGTYIGSGYVHDDASGKGEKSITFHPELPAGTYEVRLAYSPGANRSERVPVTILSVEGEKLILVDERATPPLAGRYLPLGRYRFENNQGTVMLSNEGTQGYVTADAVIFLPLGDAGRERSPERAPAGTLEELEARLRTLKEAGPNREMVMSLREEEKIQDLRVLVRGNVHTPSEPAPRGVLEVTEAGSRLRMPPNESGRRELADWIASPGNPLTARVMVNRVWHWLFGAGLVRTTDNFGTTGEAPSHPELLDALALDFMAHGWSVKHLVREIVRSETYRQAGLPPGAPDPRDPDNRLLRGAPRRRLDAEALRDLMLSASGRLKLGPPPGPTYPPNLSADYGYASDSPLRSVYLPVFRNALPEMLHSFDFADPSVSTGQRNESTIASQALFMMNSPFVLGEARRAAERLLSGEPADDRGRMVRAYRLVLGRAPSAREEAAILRVLGSGENPLGAWTRVFHALFASAELRFIE